MDARSQALTALSQFLVSDCSLQETLDRVAVVTTDAMAGADMAGITLLGDEGAPTTAVFTDEESPEIDEAQYRSGRGPCLDAWRRKQVVSLPVIGQSTDAYPEFTAACVEHGVRSTLSLPLVAGERGLGALNLYARIEHGFTSEDERIGLELAATASVVLANASDYWEAFTLGEQLNEAIRSRAVIEQAKGMLMARSPDISAEGAFDLLRKASQRENRKLRDVAQRIVDRSGQ